MQQDTVTTLAFPTEHPAPHPIPGVCPECRRRPSSPNGIMMAATPSWPITERACDDCTDDLYSRGAWGF